MEIQIRQLNNSFEIPNSLKLVDDAVRNYYKI